MDSQRRTWLLLQLRRALKQHPQELCTVYRMSPGARRERGVNGDGRISNLFQGAYPVARDRRGSIYPGDREIRTPDQVTIQIHLVDLTEGAAGEVLVGEVPILAVWVPSRLAMPWIAQEAVGAE